ncbi:MAG TPA: hypothetical protein VK700_19065 [Steroidobacteraceae bacterium]|jgi:hypothetical protein|nr:hypothetical protein [Steroidobacteraceae bacterium]
MAVALVLDGVPDIQLSLADGVECLKELLADRLQGGCTISPMQEPSLGIEYRIQHPGAGVELAYLTDYPDPGNEDWDTGG